MNKQHYNSVQFFYNEHEWSDHIIDGWDHAGNENLEVMLEVYRGTKDWTIEIFRNIFFYFLLPIQRTVVATIQLRINKKQW